MRSLLHRMGLRFRLHRADLPGRPDIVLPRHGLVVFVHGCFWHRHARCRWATTPATRRRYWMEKFDRNVARDRRDQRRLRAMGWSVMVIWECELRRPERLEARLRRRIAGQATAAAR